MKKFFILVLVVFFSHHLTSACKLSRTESPLKSVFPGSYVMVGEVVGYTDKIESRAKEAWVPNEDKFFGAGRGYKIKPLEIIYTPTDVPVDYYELFTFGVTPWCAPNINDADLPVGTKIRFVASESALLPSRSPENIIRLEQHFLGHLSIIRPENEFENGNIFGFDYENRWKALSEKFAATKNYEKVYNFDNFIYIETIKDLIRLKNADSSQKRYEILERLLYNPKVDFPALIAPELSTERLRHLNRLSKENKDIEKIQRDVLNNKIELTDPEKKLMENRLKLEDSGYFEIKYRN